MINSCIDLLSFSFFIIAIAVLIAVLIASADIKIEKLKVILNFLQSIIVIGMILCSIVYLTKFSHESNIQDMNCSDSKSKEKDITKIISTNQCVNINIETISK